MSTRTLPTSGLHLGVDEREYHSDRESLSSTGAKTLLKSPALFRHQLDHPVFKDSFDHGSGAHKYVLGVGADVVRVEADSWRTKAAQEQRDAARVEGKIPLLAAVDDKAKAMAEKVHQHRLASLLLAEGSPEVSMWATDPDTGVLMRGRADWLGKRLIVDYKTTNSADPWDLTGRYGTVAKLGYAVQAQWYLRVARACGHPAEGFLWIFQEKDPPHQVSVAFCDDDDLRAADARVDHALATYADCVAADEWPEYISPGDAARLSLTDMHYNTETLA